MSSDNMQTLVTTARNLFAQGQVAQALAATENLVAQGGIDLDLLDQAWRQAALLDDTDFMARVLASVKKVAPKTRHWRLTMLQASYHEVRHEWKEKIVALRKAKKQGADPALVMLHEASARERLLQPEKALAVLDRFRGQGDSLDHAQAIRARCFQQLKETAKAKALLESWLPDAGENVAAVSGRKLLARLHDKTGDWESAWHWASQGNHLSAKLYKAALGDNDIRWRVEIWHHLFRADSQFQLPTYDVSKGGSEEMSPVFLLGFPRSGTTLLEQILDAHPKITAMEEPPTVTDALRQAVEMAKARAWLRGSLKQPGLSKKQALVRIFQEMSNFSQGEIRRLRDIYWESARKRLGNFSEPVLLDKMPLNTVDMAFINMLFPRARFIVALRHPADVLLSCYMQSFEANDAMVNFHEMESAAIFYRQVMGLLERYQARLSLEGRMHFIRYEDLTADFDTEAEALMMFLGLPFEPTQQNYHEHARQRGTLATPSYQGVTQPIYRNAVDRWQNYNQWMGPAFEHLAAACRCYGYSLELQERKSRG